MKRLERYESYHGRTTPEVEWRAWNEEHTCYMAFRTKREAIAYLSIKTGSTQP